ncbi:hypothetical protein SISSUDRAFT_652742 [Sistotremastrum suecicum HHB10207 ss-3]|uniref:Uncharacterized protein n=1 Tax=Sistotremastrum suecicum HHB10207 ss-3 TaxID=1314776 RepID=A0A166E842_9AGAM|nr:hypothetical protein SISSUDRAFT_652742 [Sistotremastrum suecicum HHB10207 ss-3]
MLIEDLSRSQLQRLAKKKGIKANQRSEKLRQALVEHGFPDAASFSELLERQSDTSSWRTMSSPRSSRSRSITPTRQVASCDETNKRPQAASVPHSTRSLTPIVKPPAIKPEPGNTLLLSIDSDTPSPPMPARSLEASPAAASATSESQNTVVESPPEFKMITTKSGHTVVIKVDHDDQIFVPLPQAPTDESEAYPYMPPAAADDDEDLYKTEWTADNAGEFIDDIYRQYFDLLNQEHVLGKSLSDLCKEQPAVPKKRKRSDSSADMPPAKRELREASPDFFDYEDEAEYESFTAQPGISTTHSHTSTPSTSTDKVESRQDAAERIRFQDALVQFAFELPYSHEPSEWIDEDIRAAFEYYILPVIPSKGFPTQLTEEEKELYSFERLFYLGDSEQRSEIDFGWLERRIPELGVQYDYKAFALDIWIAERRKQLADDGVSLGGLQIDFQWRNIRLELAKAYVALACQECEEDYPFPRSGNEEDWKWWIETPRGTDADEYAARVAYMARITRHSSKVRIPLNLQQKTLDNVTKLVWDEAIASRSTKYGRANRIGHELICHPELYGKGAADDTPTEEGFVNSTYRGGDPLNDLDESSSDSEVELQIVVQPPSPGASHINSSLAPAPTENQPSTRKRPSEAESEEREVEPSSRKRRRLN